MERWSRTHWDLCRTEVEKLADGRYGIVFIPFDDRGSPPTERPRETVEAAKRRADEMIPTSHSCEESKCTAWQPVTVRLGTDRE